MAYLGRQPNTGVRSRYIYTATASQTTFSGSDDDGKTLKYEDAAYVDVFLNGVLLKPVTDYAATTKTSVVLTSGAAASDIVEIVAYDIANIADTVSKANGGTFEGNVNFTDNVKAIFGAELEIYSDATHARIREYGSGQLKIQGNNMQLLTSDGASTYLEGNASTSAVTLYHASNAPRLATTSTGIDVTGTAVTDGVTVAGNLSVDGGTIKLDGNYPVGTGNVALGDTALNSLTTGSYNTAVGNTSLNANTSGERNTAVGHDTLGANTTGQYNSSLGFASLAANTTASNNTSIGYKSMFANSTGANNVAVGMEALQSNTTSNTSTAIGYQALRDNTSASMTAVGAYALKSHTSGVGSVAVGDSALTSQTTGGQNVAIGNAALLINTTGSTNTAVGYSAGFLNSTASNCTFVGWEAGYSNGTGSSNTYIGKEAGHNSTGNNNVFVGQASGYNSTGSQNTFIGWPAGLSMTSGTGNIIIGNFNGNQSGLDIRTSNNHLVIADGANNIKIHVTDANRFRASGIYSATTGAGANVVVTGTNGQLERSTSSRRYKNTINDATHGLAELLTLRAVTYKGNNDGDKVFGGMIAEEVHDAGLTEFVQYNEEGEPDSISYGNMVSLCIKAIQELSAKNDALEARLAALENA